MRRSLTFSALAQVPGLFLNFVQDALLSLLPGSGAETTTATGQSLGCWWQAVAGLADSGATGANVIDALADWRDRQVTATLQLLTDDTYRPGGTADYTDWGDALAPPVTVMGYLGTGANSNTTTGDPVSAGAPPVAGGGAHPSYRLKISANIFLFADPSDGSLRVYNATGAAVPAFLVVQGAKMGRH